MISKEVALIVEGLEKSYYVLMNPGQLSPFSSNGRGHCQDHIEGMVGDRSYKDRCSCENNMANESGFSNCYGSGLRSYGLLGVWDYMDGELSKDLRYIA